ncbi:MAG: DUF1289 domain-containing protein [Rickettsiales bacterium]|nr:DUF1289 domain-containing protein [Rickettsiales bacterium]OUV53799.1 MAG: hypothetical protein CBC87_03625 [Rickettsiales bacterium TMED127]
MTEISPCKKICKLSKSKSHCLTCLRTIDEITNWKNFSFSEKKKIIHNLNYRK